jgi:hypothetical protein
MPAELIDVLKTGGPVVVLLVFIGWWGLNRKWVFGWIYEQEQTRHKEEIAEKNAEIKRWQDMALNLGGLAARASNQAIAAIQETKPPPARPRRGAGHDTAPE